MPTSLGFDPELQLVYAAMLADSALSLSALAEQVGLSETATKAALDRLADLDLVQPEGATGALRVLPPRLGFAKFIADAEADLLQRQQALVQAKQAIATLAAEHDAAQERESVVRIAGVEAVRLRLAELSLDARHECLTFTPGVAHTPEAQGASQPLNEQALARGVAIQSVYQGSFRNDASTLAYALHMAELGGQTRTVPVVPIQMVLVDREVALVPIDPEQPTLGALEIRTPGIVAALCALFDQVWSGAERLDDFQRRGADDRPSMQELELLRLLGAGHTDESAARRLDLSVRTVRRMMADLTNRLDAHSRFEAGAKAAQRGWLD
ncbi:MAG TPA: helix-turn-helix transcriptional regulator [Marmoricola sp.]|nr:helix-turn-helix transcriptional regulator [Marmoricola sp.]